MVFKIYRIYKNFGSQYNKLRERLFVPPFLLIISSLFASRISPFLLTIPPLLLAVSPPKLGNLGYPLGIAFVG